MKVVQWILITGILISSSLLCYLCFKGFRKLGAQYRESNERLICDEETEEHQSVDVD